MPLLDISNLRKAFASPDGTPQLVVDIPAFQLARREQVGLRGGSGAGKTTFLHLIAGILIPDAGSIWLDGAELQALHEAARDRFRAMCIGYVFQSFNLLQGLTCLENVLVAMSFGRGADRSAAEALLRRVGLGHRLHHRPRQLSSGQQQRVAVARALANHPRLVLADEPTGNLDEQSGAAVLRLIRDTCHETEAALLLVSHDREVLAGFDRLIDFPVLNCACTHAPPQPPTPNSELRP